MKILIASLLITTSYMSGAFAEDGSVLSSGKHVGASLDSEYVLTIILNGDLVALEDLLESIQDPTALYYLDFFISDPLELAYKAESSGAFLLMIRYMQPQFRNSELIEKVVRGFFHRFDFHQENLESELLKFIQDEKTWKLVGEGFIAELVQRGFVRTFEFMIKKRPELIHVTSGVNKASLLELSILSKNLKIVEVLGKYLLQLGLPLDEENVEGKTAYDLAEEQGFSDAVKVLKGLGADTTPYAVKQKLYEALYGWQIGDFEEKFQIFLNLYTENQSSVSKSFLDALYLECIERSCKTALLIDFFHNRGVDLNLQSLEDGSTGLIKLATRGWLAPFRRLLELGADPNVKNQIGYVVLDYASSEFAAAILSSGADLVVPVGILNMFKAIMPSEEPLLEVAPEKFKSSRVLVYDDPIRPTQPEIFESYFMPKLRELGANRSELYDLLERLILKPEIRLSALSEDDQKLVRYLSRYDVNSYHGEMVAMGFIAGENLRAANELSILSSSTDGDSWVNHNSADFGLDAIFKKFRSDKADVISNSSSPKTKSAREKLAARKVFSDFSEQEQVYFVTSAGNEGIAVYADFKYSDYYFVVAAVDSEGGLASISGGGSNYGDATLAAKSFLDLPSYNFEEERVDVLKNYWGATSYATPQVAALIGKALNRLPESMRYQPRLMKRILIETGDFSSDLVGKIENPVVINEVRALETLDSNLFFEVTANGEDMFMHLDKRLDELLLRNVTTKKLIPLKVGETLKIKSKDQFVILDFKSKVFWGLSSSIYGKRLSLSHDGLGKALNASNIWSTLD